jgi:hypothetical protein
MQSIFRNGDQLNEQAVSRVAQLYDFPDYVKAADVDDAFPSQTRQLPVTVFGDAHTRSFAVHNKAACWLAAVDFEEQRTRFSSKYATRVEAAITKAATAWGILPDVERVRNAAVGMRQTSLEKLADSEFALVRHLGDQVERQYPLRNAAESVAAATWFRKYAAEFTRRDRQTIARKIADRCEDTGAALDDGTHEFLDKVAGYGVPDCRQLGAAVAQRGRLVSNPAVSRELMKVAGLLYSAADGQPLSPDVLDGMLDNLDVLDRNYRFTSRYGGDLMMPEEACYTVGLHKAAATLQEVVQLTSGHVYTKDALAELPLARVTDVFGVDIAEQCSSDGLFVDREKLAEVAATLPRQDALALHSLLQRHGVQELTDKTAAVPAARLSHADWVSLVPA